MYWSIYDIFMIISKAHHLYKKPQQNKETKKNKPLTLCFTIMSSIAEIILFTKHVLQF